MVDEEGFLGNARLSPQLALRPFWVRLEGARLTYDPGAAEVDPKGMLDAFIRIRDGADVVRFARRYGVLQICEHGFPASHNPPALGFSERGGLVTWCYPLGFGEADWWEPLDRWYYFADQARAMVAIAANLRQDKPGTAGDWGAVFAAHPRERIDALCERLGQSVQSGRVYLRQVLLEWLSLGNVRPGLRWPGEEEVPSLSFTGGTFGLLGVQLLFAIAAAHQLAICSGCGTPYLRKKPRRKRHNFCENCGERVASRLRQRRRRKGDSDEAR